MKPAIIDLNWLDKEIERARESRDTALIGLLQVKQMAVPFPKTFSLATLNMTKQEYNCQIIKQILNNKTT